MLILCFQNTAATLYELWQFSSGDGPMEASFDNSDTYTIGYNLYPDLNTGVVNESVGQMLYKPVSTDELMTSNHGTVLHQSNCSLRPLDVQY